MTGLIFLVVIGTAIWVGFDSSNRRVANTSAATWVIGCLLLWILVFPMYLVKRGRVQNEAV